jgi:hypothetical protein
MDDRFDELTRDMAGAVPRRDLLRRLAVGAGLAAIALLRPGRANAAGSCTPCGPNGLCCTKNQVCCNSGIHPFTWSCHAANQGCPGDR